MTRKLHDIEILLSDPQDHAQPPRPDWKRAHRDWRAWFAMLLMLGMMVIYVVTDSSASSPDTSDGQPVPEIHAP